MGVQDEYNELAVVLGEKNARTHVAEMIGEVVPLFERFEHRDWLT
jgi:hypothetical protein